MVVAGQALPAVNLAAAGRTVLLAVAKENKTTNGGGILPPLRLRLRALGEGCIVNPADVTGNRIRTFVR